jgi:aminoglycoside phosphotransferase (APT) family kinase protein
MEVIGVHNIEYFDGEESFRHPQSSSVSNSDDSQLPEEAPMEVLLRRDAIKELQSVDAEALIRIASALNGEAKCTISPSMTCIGASNIVIFINFDDTHSTQWVARLPLLGFNSLTDDSKLLTELIESMVTTMQHLSENTSIPVPKIHGWSGTSDNELNRPYVIMDAASGSNLYQLARNGLDMGSVGEQLYSFVDQWAKYTAEMASLQFGQIGSLRKDVEGHVIVDRLCTQANVHFTPHLHEDSFRGPFNSVVEYLLISCELKYQALLSELNVVSHSYRDYLRLKLLETLLPYYVNPALVKGPFVLSHVDFDYQNILVDEKNGFTITGIVDWDLAAVVPLQSHLRVPDILMCDTWTEAKRLAKHISGWQSLIKYLREKQLDYPAERLLQSGYMFSRFERALSETPDVETFELLWTHVYGTDSNWKRTVEGMLASDWGLAMAERLSLPMSEDNANGLVVDVKAANLGEESHPVTQDHQVSKSHEIKPKQTTRLWTKFRRGWSHVELCLLCSVKPIQLPTRMHSNPRLGELWWRSKN